VGIFDGEADGAGVDFPGRYVGSRVGDDVGAFDGFNVGEYVAFPGT